MTLHFAQPRPERVALVLAVAIAAAGCLAPALAQDPVEFARQYNQACRLSQAGDQAGAVAAFGQALELGFDDADFALEDPDLRGLRDNPEFQGMIQALRSRLQLLSSEKGHTLSAGQWTEPFVLEGAPGTSDSPPVMRLLWQPLGLDFELELTGDWARLQYEKTPPPWAGGPGLVITLAVPDSRSSYSGDSHFVLAFGLEKSSPVGGIFIPRGGWQRVLELDPEIRIDENAGTLTMVGTIPWQSIQPFHPLVDPQLGFNAALRIPRDGQFIKAELFPDPGAFSPGVSERRRFARLDFLPESETRESLMGKVDHSFVSGKPLTVNLAAISSEGGQGILTLDYTDNGQVSVLPGGPVRVPVKLNPGFNGLEQMADFSGLRSGLYVIRAELEFPSGRAAVWSTVVLQLGDSWRQQLDERIARLPAAEVRTGRFYLQAVADALDNLRNRFNPGPIATTLNDLDRLLARAVQSGSILPASGAVILVYPGPADQDRLCTVYLPEGFRKRGPINPVLIMNRTSGLEARLANRVARSYEFEGHLGPDEQTTPYSPIYLIPHPERGNGSLKSDLAENEACLSWALSYFQAEGAALCGVDSEGGPALLLTREQPNRIRGVQIMAGDRLEPWPQATREFLAAQLRPAPPEVPINWVDFIQETRNAGQAADLLAVIRDLGYRVDEVQTVRGALALTQVADRVVLWAEALP